MDASRRIQIIRGALVVALIAGSTIGFFGLAIGQGLAGLAFGAAGWLIVIAALVWLVIAVVQRTSAASRPTVWRPGDEQRR